MKYLLFLLLSSALFANYQQGVAHYKDGNFSNSYEIFQKLFREDMTSPKVSFYLGLSAFQLQLYDESAIAFERVLILEPSHLRSELELARVYFFLGNLKESKTRLKRVLSAEIPDEVRENVKMLLSKVRKEEKRNFFTLNFGVETGFETNINSSAGDEKIKSYLSEKYGLERGGIEAEDRIDSIYHNETAQLQHKYKFDDFYLKNSLNFFNQTYLEDENYNILYGSFDTVLGFRNFQIQLLADRVFYAEEPLLNSYFAKLRYFHNFGHFHFETYLKHRQKKFIESERDSSQNDGRISLFRNFGKNLIGIEYGYLIEKKDGGTHRFIDKDEHSFRAIYQRKLPFGVSAHLQYFQRLIGFEDKIDEEIREDDYKSYQVSLSKEWGDFSGNISFSKIENLSNYALVEFDKEIISFGINYKY
jgi:hypothetical protein